MSDEKDKAKPSGIRGRLSPWFIPGFIVVWIGMACSINTYALSLDGGNVIACKLSTYYLIEIRRAVNDSGAIGPATGTGSGFLVTALQHGVFATVGGASAMGAVWLACTFKRRRRS